MYLITLSHIQLPISNVKWIGRSDVKDECILIDVKDRVRKFYMSPGLLNLKIQEAHLLKKLETIDAKAARLNYLLNSSNFEDLENVTFKEYDLVAKCKTNKCIEKGMYLALDVDKKYILQEKETNNFLQDLQRKIDDPYTKRCHRTSFVQEMVMYGITYRGPYRCL